MIAHIALILLYNSWKDPLSQMDGTKIASYASVMRPTFASRAIKNQSGFTMVELVVVVVILTLAVGIGVPTYHLTIKPRAQLNGAARHLYSDIQLARLRAVSRTVRCGVVFSAGPSYTIFVDENKDSVYNYTDDGDPTNDEEVVKTFNLGTEYLGVQYDTSKGDGGDGIDFTNNTLIMTPRGIPTGLGGPESVYLVNQNGEGRKLVVNGVGGVRLEKY